ncbi:hypothetical protein INP51_10735 [Blautia liquoris]|uniref:Uncharacterized protein n=1 Tax=Blautia liquoris TaxID=2779518 RepID=A0A7M2RDW8_9FIRM|nr:hypothetical protein [Blautia liquoris]QOV18486.1 hypothetical protein INP51_10735 [Blautia liquoris]
MKEKRPQEGWKDNVRVAIYAMAGVYLLSLSYNMFRAISSSHGNEQLLMIVFTILFTVIGFGMVFFGIVSGYKNRKKMRETQGEKEES